jgi:arabinofuranosyltransferase
VNEPAASESAARNPDEAWQQLTQRLILLPLGVLLYVALVNAWSADDAFITFRTARNVWEGHGLTWNPGWRVQAYTHPSWLMLSIVAHGITGECYFSMLTLSVVITVGCGVLIYWLSHEAEQHVRALGVLAFSVSAAAMQYAVSGLENPLLFALLISYVAIVHDQREAGPDWKPALVVALIGLTRTDALLLVAPSLIVCWYHAPRRLAALRSLTIGLLPLAAWHVFSILYYGIPFANTAIAKLNINVGTGHLLRQGLLYLQDSATRDPISLCLVGASLFALIASGDRYLRAFALGIALYVVYVVRVGGDFMTGRFIGAPFVLALAAALRCPPIASCGKRLVGAAAVMIAVYGLAWPSSPWVFRFSRGYGMTLEEAVAPTGIADERGFYYRSTGLLHMLVDRPDIERLGLPLPPQEWAQEGASFARSNAGFMVRESIGYFGYFAGDKMVVDACGLADPFLARIPECTKEFRIGHCIRAMPAGYQETLVSGRNQLEDPGLAQLYDRVHALSAGPLFSSARWRAILCLNLGLCGGPQGRGQVGG